MEANKRYAGRAFAGIILVSDNQSWVNSGRIYGCGRAASTGVMSEWEKFKQGQQRLGIAEPKLVCIDIAPYGNNSITGATGLVVRTGKSKNGD